MENKINIAELIKDCPEGMELDCILYDNIYFDTVEHNSIKCYIQNKGYRTSITFDVYGGLIDSIPTKCVIFPKGKTTWEGFVPPCKFKDGDIITCETPYCKFTALYKNMRSDTSFNYHFMVKLKNGGVNDNSYGDFVNACLATGEEKQKLFDAIKANGYKWNAETKTLEKLEPRFKVGDRIEFKYHERSPELVVKVKDNGYILSSGKALMFQDENAWELYTGKFDVTTLKPFDKVLCRDKDNEVWTANIYSHYDSKSERPFICIGWNELNAYITCIPYEGNEHLLGTINDCDKYYKTW